jgi:threonine/homoserine/homoserine lactone efflux protein
MPTITTLATFVLLVAVFAAVPGPSNLYVVAQGLRAGPRPALAGALGCALGAMTYVAATTLGLAAVLASSAATLSVLHYVGGAYLILLGIRAWRGGGHPARACSSEREGAAARSLRQGFLVELSNPKVALFFLALFPQFVHRDQGAALLVLGVTFSVVGLLSDSLYALASSTFRARVVTSHRLATRTGRISGMTYLGLGAWAIWSGATTRPH